MSLKKSAIDLIIDKKVLVLSETDKEIKIEVGQENVRLFKKPGRTLISCSCENHAKFCNQPALCKHKIAAIYQWVSEGLK